MSVKTPASGQVVVGGYNEGSYLSNVELFPCPPSDTCSIPDLPHPRFSHSLSLLSGGRLVVCGGNHGSNYVYFDSCISWIAGNTSWTPLYTMRCLPIIKDKPALLIIRLFFAFVPHSIFVKLKITTNDNPLYLSNTFTARRDVFTRLGRPHPFPTPLSCSAEIAIQQSSLQR